MHATRLSVHTYIHDRNRYVLLACPFGTYSVARWKRNVSHDTCQQSHCSYRARQLVRSAFHAEPVVNARASFRLAKLFENSELFQLPEFRLFKLRVKIQATYLKIQGSQVARRSRWFEDCSKLSEHSNYLKLIWKFELFEFFENSNGRSYLRIQISQVIWRFRLVSWKFRTFKFFKDSDCLVYLQIKVLEDSDPDNFLEDSNQAELEIYINWLRD